MKKITREQFMEFFRSEEFSEIMTVSDCRELFLYSLKGESDITRELLDELCAEYSVDLDEVL